MLQEHGFAMPGTLQRGPRMVLLSRASDITA